MEEARRAFEKYERELNELIQKLFDQMNKL
jgi:hypothetical protein